MALGQFLAVRRLAGEVGGDLLLDLQGSAVGRNRLLQPCRAALALAQGRKRVAEIVLGSSPVVGPIVTARTRYFSGVRVADRPGTKTRTRAGYLAARMSRTAGTN